MTRYQPLGVRFMGRMVAEVLDTRTGDVIRARRKGGRFARWDRYDEPIRNRALRRAVQAAFRAASDERRAASELRAIHSVHKQAPAAQLRPGA